MFQTRSAPSSLKLVESATHFPLAESIVSSRSSRCTSKQRAYLMRTLALRE